MRSPLALAFFAASLAPQVASAAVPPLSQEQLVEQSDLIIDGQALTARCDGSATENQIERRAAVATTLHVGDIIKGRETGGTYVSGDTVQVDVRGYVYELKGAVSCFWEAPAIPKGWAGRLYLKRVDGQLQVFAQNGAVEDTSRSTPEPAPPCGISSTEVQPTPMPTSMPTGFRPDSLGDDTGGGGCAVGNAGHPSGAALLLGFVVLFARRRRAR